MERMHLVAITSFIAGLIVVIVGAELIVRGGSRVGALLGVSPMILGLTVVAIGTSTPELAVGLTAAAEGNGGLAVGNIAGTNIVNILLILGLSAWIMPLKVQLLSLKLDLPVMVGSALALLWMAWDGLLSRQEGAWMVAASVLYTIAMVRLSRRESLPIQQEFSREYSAKNILPRVATLQGTVSVLMLLAGIVVVVVGAELLVSGAVDIAKSLGVSDAVVGLTIVAIGTSAPELATTIMGTLKNERDIAIGNLIGSSTYNILFILGVTFFGVVGMFPGMIISSIDPAATVTAFNGASSQLTLKIMLGVALVTVPIVLAYQFWLYKTFSAPVTDEDLKDEHAY